MHMLPIASGSWQGQASQQQQPNLLSVALSLRVLLGTCLPPSCYPLLL
jgi:hypothetical protein